MGELAGPTQRGIEREPAPTQLFTEAGLAVAARRGVGRAGDHRDTRVSESGEQVSHHRRAPTMIGHHSVDLRAFGVAVKKHGRHRRAAQHLRDDGVDRDRQEHGAVGPERLLVGTVELGATNLGPGHVRQTTINPFVIGELDGSIRDRTRALARVLEPVEEVRITDNIRGQLWSKLLVNSALSGLGVVGGCTYGEVAAHPEGRQAIFEVWSEGHEIGMAQGLSLETVLA